MSMTTKTRIAIEAIELLRAGVDDAALCDSFNAQINDAIACANDEDRQTLQAAINGDAAESGESRAPETTQSRWLPPMNARQAKEFAARMNSKEARAERQRKLANLRSNPGMRAMRSMVIGCPVDLVDRLLPVTGKK